MPSELDRIPQRFGETVRNLRKANKLSQIELAELAGLTHNYIGEVERAEKLASLETIIRVASALRLKGAELLAKAEL